MGQVEDALFRIRCSVFIEVISIIYWHLNALLECIIGDLVFDKSYAPVQPYYNTRLPVRYFVLNLELLLVSK